MEKKQQGPATAGRRVLSKTFYDAWHSGAPRSPVDDRVLPHSYDILVHALPGTFVLAWLLLGAYALSRF